MVIKKEKHYNWKGGFYISAGGYKIMLCPEHPRADCKGYYPEHRLVMEKKIGRYLVGKECVHHINHIRTDNRPENLMLFLNAIEHINFESKIRRNEWATDGRICPRCGKYTKPENLTATLKTCRDCEKERHKKWRDAKHDHLIRYCSEYREKNKDKIKARTKIWKERNRHDQ